jgi:transglutaminase-like putative cysteine protease
MLLHVVHQTDYTYAPPAKTAQHMAYLRPLHDARQQLLRHRLEISPPPVLQEESLDVYGNSRAFFSLPSSHDHLRIVADSLVATSEPPVPEHRGDWEAARERMRYHRDAAYDPATEFIFPSPHVPRHENFALYARPCFGAGTSLLQGARDLMTRIHEDFTYATDATDVSTPALEALQMRRGVCQDFTHVMLGCLRSLGLPARYVSGYLLTALPAGQPRLVGSDASHAWVSVYLPAQDGAGQWTELDPTNNRAPGQDYVVLARGRDYADVSPLRGVLHGGAHHRLRVGVTVQPVAQAPAASTAAPRIV